MKFNVGGKIIENSPSSWSLDNLLRVDIEQADIAPLMSVILGTYFPVNSVGVLPIKFLNTSEKKKSELLFQNSLQIWNQFHKGHLLHQQKKFFYQKYSKFNEIENIKDEISNMNEENIEKKIELTEIFISLTLNGLRYLQTYDRLMLFFFTCSSYVLWIIYLAIWVKKNSSPQQKKIMSENFIKLDLIFVVLILFSYCFLFFEKSPFTYYLYISFPIYLLREVICEKEIFKKIISKTFFSLKNINNFFVLLMTPIILEIIVFGYFKREVFFFCFVCIGIWGLMSPIKNIFIKLFWLITTLSTSIFPLLPVNHGDSLTLVVIGGILVFLFSLFFNYLIYISQKKKFTNSNLIQLLFSFITIISVYTTTISLQQKNGLPFLNQMLNWFILIFYIFSFFIKKKISQIEILSNLFVSLSSLYLLFCVSYESLFFLSFCLMLFAWILIEKEIRTNSKKSLSIHEFRSGKKIIYY